MRIKIWASADPEFPNHGPYKMLDIVEKDAPYSFGEMTHYGAVIIIPPPGALSGEGVDQSVIVKLNPASLTARPDESVFEKPPYSYDKIEFFPIHVDRHGYWTTNPPKGPYPILETDNLTIEDVSSIIKPNTFSVWARDCSLSKATVSALQGVTYAIVHRYTTNGSDRDAKLDCHSTEIVNMAVACLSLIRPTRRSRAGNMRGLIKADGMFDPQDFTAHDPAEVPEVQKLFTIENQDIDLLRSVLPEFIKLYQRDETGTMTDDYEPIRMAVQLYEQAYAIHHWKARHILWWSAIEALYGNNESAATARIYAAFGDKKLEDGFRRSIYETKDIPSQRFPVQPQNTHTLGEMVPRIYAVRNASAHGQKVPNPNFTQVPHPLGGTAPLIDVLAEAATFIIRKTVIGILQRGFREDFKDGETRDRFWLMEYGLDKHQSKKRRRELKDCLTPEEKSKEGDTSG